MSRDCLFMDSRGHSKERRMKFKKKTKIQGDVKRIHAINDIYFLYSLPPSPLIPTIVSYRV